MKSLFILLIVSAIASNSDSFSQGYECYKEVDQILWVVSDLEKTMTAYEQLGFTGIHDLGVAFMESTTFDNPLQIRLARANLGGAMVNWIQPPDNPSLFRQFLDEHGEGAISLIHWLPDEAMMDHEVKRLKERGVNVLDKINIISDQESMHFVLLDTKEKGKYILGFTYCDEGLGSAVELEPDNRHSMKLSQYAFAIRDPEPVSAFWHSLGLPEFEINHPVLGETRYYGKLTDHKLIQGWQRHGSIAYEWCIPVKPPIVYEDHIKLHGEGIHHLAFNVEDMDTVLDDLVSRGFVVSMGGTWGEKGKPGFGRYEYIDMDNSGGLTIELLWSFH